MLDREKKPGAALLDEFYLFLLRIPFHFVAQNAEKSFQGADDLPLPERY